MSQLQRILKENTLAIAFGILIIFAGLSILTNANQGSQNAQQLISFAESSVTDVRTDITNITNKTITLEKSSENFDQIITDLQNLSSKLTTLTSQVPNKNTDIESRKLENGLKNFYLNIKTSVDTITSNYQKQKDLQDSYANYSAIQQVSQNGDKQQLTQSIQAGQKILEFEKEKASKLIETTQKAAAEKRVQSEQELLTKSTQLLQKTGSSLTDSQKQELQTIYQSGWPVNADILPRIRREEIENQEFAKNIQTLQSYVSELKQKYNLK
jgi:hypothetical protein